MGPVPFHKWLVRELDKDGFAPVRALLVEGLIGDVVEIGAGTGAMFPYYGDDVSVSAIEPDDAFRAAAQQEARARSATIRVLAGVAESLPFDDASIDAVVASTVLCSVQSVQKTLAEFRRVLKPDADLRLLEHVRGERWPDGLLMDLLNPLWLRVNKVGCNWNRRAVESVRNAGFTIVSVQNYKFFSAASPAAFPLRLIKAKNVREA